MTRPHISELVKDYFALDGWIYADVDGGTKATRTITFDKLAGTISNGDRLVTLQMDSTGRWLEAVDGWGAVIGSVDLRDYWSKTGVEAVRDVIAKAYPL